MCHQSRSASPDKMEVDSAPCLFSKFEVKTLKLSQGHADAASGIKMETASPSEGSGESECGGNSKGSKPQPEFYYSVMRNTVKGRLRRASKILIACQLLSYFCKPFGPIKDKTFPSRVKSKKPL